MALIVCKECGKKISDTSERCIHCGAPTAASVSVQEVTHKEVPEKPVKKEPAKDYFKLTEETRIQLEINFLQKDAWAEKYRSKGMELKAFRNLCYLAIGLLMPFVSIYMIVAFRIMDGKFANLMALYMGAIAALVLLISSSVLVKVFSVRIRRYEESDKKLVYMKKFQQWLLKEKNIMYKPFFEDEYERVQFEAVDLEKLDY